MLRHRFAYKGEVLSPAGEVTSAALFVTSGSRGGPYVKESPRLLSSGTGSEPARDSRDRGGIMRGKILTILEKASLQGYVDEEMKDAIRRLAFEEKPDFFMLEAGLALVEVFKESMDRCIDDISQGDIEEALLQ